MTATRPPRGDALDDLATVVRGLLVAAGALALLPVAATLVLRQVGVTSTRLVAYVAGTPMVLAAGVAAIGLLALGRSRLGTAVALVLTAVLALTQAPLYLGTASAATGATPLVVMTINLHNGLADVDEVVATVRDRDVDVLATQELTVAAVDALQAAGIEELLPHAHLTPGGAHGNGLWSRLPLDPVAVPSGFHHPPVAATTTLDGVALFLACVHPVSPYPRDTAIWSAEMGQLREWLDGVAPTAVVAGDFNATPDHRQFRDVLASGYEDAATQVGAGWLPTFPANRRRVPLLIAIDHVIASGGIVATRVDRLDIGATDHAGLAVELAVPPAG